MMDMKEVAGSVLERIVKQRCSDMTVDCSFATFDINVLHRELVELDPRLMLCIKSVKASGSMAGAAFRFTLHIDYTDVYPSFVTVVTDTKQVLDSLFTSVSLHRSCDCFVCNSGELSQVVDTARSVVRLPAYLNCFISGIQPTVTKRAGTDICGVTVKLNYSCDYATWRSRLYLVDKKTDEIAALARRCGIEDWRKAISVISYCVKNWSYQRDLGGLEFTAYSALVDNSAVCMGFSLAICAIFKKLCIPCRYICGKRDGQGHAWNMVYIKGGWFYIDVTDAVTAGDPFFRWGVTSFDDGREIETPCTERLVCNCPREYIQRSM